MMKEIGGYFELENLKGKEYHNKALRFNTARNALAYLCLAKKIKKIYIPFYLCDSVFKCLKREKINYEFYHVNGEFYPDFDRILGENEYIYIVNYYGIISNKEIECFKIKYRNIIIDNTHAFFRMPVVGVDTLYSCRKFFGVPDGSYLYTDTLDKYKELRKDNSNLRMEHILGRYESRANKYFDKYQATEASFDDIDIMKMSKLTRNLLKAIDYNDVQKKRCENYNYLKNKLDLFNKLNLEKNEGPFAYPLLVEDGNQVREKLIGHKIYVATLWKDVIINNYSSQIEKKYSSDIIPIPCDQRYNIGDMDCISDIVMMTIKNKGME